MFGTDSLRAILAAQHAPAISVYLPTFRSDLRAAENAAVFAELMGEVYRLLEDHGRREVVGPLLERLQELAGDGAFWADQADGLAVLLAPGFEQIYRLNEPFSPLAAVGPTFHVLPLVAYLHAADRFFPAGPDATPDAAVERHTPRANRDRNPWRAAPPG